jgi:hypothetical protein
VKSRTNHECAAGEGHSRSRANEQIKLAGEQGLDDETKEIPQHPCERPDSIARKNENIAGQAASTYMF